VAFDKLKEFEGLTADLRAQEESMKFGLEIFDIEPMSYPEVQLVETEIEQLTNLWMIKDQWDKQRELWKDVRFYDLEVDVMEDESIEYQQKCRAQHKDVKDWQVFKYLKNDVDKFKSTMPLIHALKQDFMRERHWKELRFEVKDDFDETSDEFTLEKVMALNLLQHEEKILELTDNAFKQLKIEKDLNNIEDTWNHDPKSNLNIDKKNSKADNEEFYMIASTENIMELIEDHGGKLGNMKSSPYYKEFDQKIDFWESNISAITETLEILLAVQGKWKYLESIFRGQPDISK